MIHILSVEIFKPGFSYHVGFLYFFIVSSAIITAFSTVASLTSEDFISLTAENRSCSKCRYLFFIVSLYILTRLLSNSNQHSNPLFGSWLVSRLGILFLLLGILRIAYTAPPLLVQTPPSYTFFSLETWRRRSPRRLFLKRPISWLSLDYLALPVSSLCQDLSVQLSIYA